MNKRFRHFEAGESPEDPGDDFDYLVPRFLSLRSLGHLVFCVCTACTFKNNMSAIASLGVKDEIKSILDSGGFLRDVEQHLKTNFPQMHYGISRRSVRRYCQANGLRRFSAKLLDKNEKENAVKKASKEVNFFLFNL